MWSDSRRCSLLNRTMKWAHVSGMMILTVCFLAGCSASSIEQEQKFYTREATQEGNVRAKSQGHGLNGTLVKELSEGFARKGIKLMNNMAADDDHGGISYMYLLNGSGRHIVKVHIFSDLAARAAGMKQMYSENADEADVENVLGSTMIRSKGYVSLVYTASGGEQDEYQEDVKHVFQHVLGQLQ